MNTANDNQVMTFSFLGLTSAQAIRVVMRGGEPWFFGSDVLGALGLDKRQGVGHYASRCAPDETIIVTPHELRGLRTAQATLVSESGLYKLVMRSDKPEARKFQDWVTREVLPAIRKDGAFYRGSTAARKSQPKGETSGQCNP